MTRRALAFVGVATTLPQPQNNLEPVLGYEMGILSTSHLRFNVPVSHPVRCDTIGKVRRTCTLAKARKTAEDVAVL